jgi:hypothetical protein
MDRGVKIYLTLPQPPRQARNEPLTPLCNFCNPSKLTQQLCLSRKDIYSEIENTNCAPL